MAINTPEVLDAHSLLIQTVLFRNGGRTVLPLLRSVHWYDRIPGDGSLFSFFTPTLRHAFIGIEDDDECTSVILVRRLRESSPFLETLDVEIDTVSLGDAELLLTRELALFDRVRKLTVKEVASFQAFRDLVTMPSVSSLVVGKVVGLWESPSSQVTAGHLQELYVKGEELALASLFKRVRFQTLKKASLNVEPSSETQCVTAAVVSVLAPFLHRCIRGRFRKSLALRVLFTLRRLPSWLGLGIRRADWPYPPGPQHALF